MVSIYQRYFFGIRSYYGKIPFRGRTIVLRALVTSCVTVPSLFRVAPWGGSFHTPLATNNAIAVTTYWAKTNS